jgi:hypothetical protein
MFKLLISAVDAHMLLMTFLALLQAVTAACHVEVP